MNAAPVIRDETAANTAAITAVTVTAFADLAVSNQTRQFIIEALRVAGAPSVSLSMGTCPEARSPSTKGSQPGEIIRLSKILMVSSAFIILLLGTLHLFYTIWGRKLRPRDGAVEVAMSEAHPYITNETTMWRAWVGFNASHSMGAILFGLIYGFLALAHPQLLFESAYLLAVGFALLLGYLVLGKRYWFRVPFTGISIALLCYTASVIVAHS